MGIPAAIAGAIGALVGYGENPRDSGSERLKSALRMAGMWAAVGALVGLMLAFMGAIGSPDSGTMRRPPR